MNNRLKFEIGFERDPDQGVGATSEESVSWGWFQIIVNDMNLCQHVVNAKVSDRVYWYLLPMLEWFAENWDSLLHETKLPPSFSDALSARQGFRNFNPYPYRDLADDDLESLDSESEDTTVFDWAERHSIRSSADGGIFPDIFLGALEMKSKSLGVTRESKEPQMTFAS